MATTRSSLLPSRRSSSENSSSRFARGSADGLAGDGVDLADGVEVVLLMVLGGLETVALRVMQCTRTGTTELLGLPQRTLHLRQCRDHR